jgi:hypothetical protein
MQLCPHGPGPDVPPSGRVDVIVRLLQEHVDDGRGHCRTCTTPGRGTPNASWPCGLFAIARYAALRSKGR